MKALCYYSRDLIKIEEISIPQIGDDEVLVKTKACGICSSDILDWYREPKAPLFFGHEVVGTIVETGEKVLNFAAGDRVFVHHHVPCMVCHYCRKGNYSMCDAFRKSSIYPGGFSEYIRVPGENVRKGLLKIPESIPSIQATFIEPLACCVQAVRRAFLEVGDRVVIFGAGFNGLLLSILAKEIGSESVVVVEPNAYRAQVAQSLGTVDAVVEPSASVLREELKDFADVVFVTPPFPEVIGEAFGVVRRGGTVLVYAPSPPGSTLPIDVFYLYFSHITLRVSYSASPLDTRFALLLLARRKDVFSRIPVVEYSFVEFEKAFLHLRRDPQVIKAILRFEKEDMLHGEIASRC